MLADFVITPPGRRTSGLFEDMQIVFQIAFDQMFLTMKILVRKGIEVIQSPSIELANPEQIRNELKNKNQRSRVTKKVCSVITKSSIAFFSFVIHKVFLNIPSLPRQIKSAVSTI